MRSKAAAGLAETGGFFDFGALEAVQAHDDALLDELQDAVRLERRNPAYLFAMGSSYFHLERYDEAASTFQDVLTLDPGHMKALYSLAVSYEKLHRTAKARSTWERYLELYPTGSWAAEARKRLKKLD